jgi:hypothetical protein
MRKLRLHTFYRLSVWLPLALPAVVIIFMNLTQWRPGGMLGVVLQLIGYSGIVGGVPYLALAIWAMFWIGSRPEREIRVRAIIAPLVMVLILLPWPVLIGIHSRFESGMSVFMLAAGASLALGYAYVAIVFALRALLFGRMDPRSASA